MYFSIIDCILYIFSCALSSGSLACFDSMNKLHIGLLTKAYTERLSVDINGNQIKAVPESPIPAFIITNNNVEKLVYIKENKVHIRSLNSRASLFIYTYMADRHILLQISSPAQVCNSHLVIFYFSF